MSITRSVGTHLSNRPARTQSAWNALLTFAFAALLAVLAVVPSAQAQTTDWGAADGQHPSGETEAPTGEAPEADDSGDVEESDQQTQTQMEDIHSWEEPWTFRGAGDAHRAQGTLLDAADDRSRRLLKPPRA